METRHFIKTLCKQNDVKASFLSILNALNVKWVPRFKALISVDERLFTSLVSARFKFRGSLFLVTFLVGTV